MFDEFSLFESTSFDDLMNDSYATESYDLFDDSYGYAFEADEAEGNDGEKKKSIIETIKNIFKKFIDGVKNFLSNLKRFIFGSKKPEKAWPGIFSYIKDIAAAAKKDAE